MKRIEGTDYYYVTKDGQILTDSRNSGLREMKQQLDTWKYYSVQLTIQGGLKKKFLVHRLVAHAFIPNPNNLKYVNHKDGNKLNNHFENLEWCTSSENQIHAYKTGLKEFPVGTKNGRNRLSEDEVIQIYWDLYNGARNVDIKNRYDIGTGTIACIKNKTNWKHLLESLPDIPIRDKRNKLSEDTVRWVCRCYEDGMTPTEVLKKSSNKNISIHQLEDIKRRRGFKNILKDYIW